MGGKLIMEGLISTEEANAGLSRSLSSPPTALVNPSELGLKTVKKNVRN
jgi:hypothetical protein